MKRFFRHGSVATPSTYDFFVRRDCERGRLRSGQSSSARKPSIQLHADDLLSGLNRYDECSIEIQIVERVGLHARVDEYDLSPRHHA